MLNRNDDGLLRYVALELRRCLEAVVYEKLWAHKDWIPADVALRWQPPQAFEALLSIEPDSDESATVAVAPRMTAGVIAPRDSFKALGVGHPPRSAWLKKTWHKLGSLLHAQWPFAQRSERPSNRGREYLEEILREPEQFVQSDITFTLANVVRFQCCEYKNTVMVNALALENGNETRCLRCNCKFLAVREGNDFSFHADIAHFPCLGCGQTIDLPSHKLAAGSQFSCPACSRRFELAGQVWQFCEVSQQGIL